MLTTTLLALALLATPAAAGTAPGPVAGAHPPPEPQRDFQEPPAGTEADRRLWRALQQATGFAALHMARIGQSAYRIRYGAYYQGLDARPEPAAGELRRRLERAAVEADQALPPDGGRLRACRYTLLDLEQRMDQLDDPAIAAELPRFRAAAADCAARLSALVAKLEPRARALEAALLEVDAFLGRAVQVPLRELDEPDQPRPGDATGERR